jgi:hypothetical protein
MASFTGTVVKGKQLARTLGCPTANIEVSWAPQGIWVSRTPLGPSISYCFDGPLETHVFDFEGDLYGREFEVTLERKVRDHREVSDIRKAIRLDMLVARIMHKLPTGISTVAWSGGKEACLVDHLVYLKGVRRMRMRLNETVEWPNDHRNFILSTSHHILESLDAWPRHMPCLVGTRREDTEDGRDFQGDWLGGHTPVLAPLYDLSYADVWALIDHLGVKVSPVYARGCTHGTTPTFDGHARDAPREDRQRHAAGARESF